MVFLWIVIVLGMKKRGGLWTIFLQVDLTSFSLHRINVVVDEANQKWRFIGIYGQPEDNQKNQTWALMRNLNNIGNLPRVSIGDYNKILFYHANEKAMLVRPEICRNFMLLFLIEASQMLDSQVRSLHGLMVEKDMLTCRNVQIGVLFHKS